MSMELQTTQSTEKNEDIAYSRSIEHLKYWINNHLDDRHSLRSLAEHAEMSITRMQRLFKEANGCSVFAYIRFKRLVRAQRQLEVTAMNIKAISAEAGYSGVPAFTAAFHSMFGDTPGRFRKGIK
jgi:AraC-like DNA-binding protein